jgi:hypothetical protein
MLTTALAVDVSGFAKACFKDIKGTEWFAPHICYAKDAGWIGGLPDGTVQPGKNISLAEAVKIIVLAEEWDLASAESFALPKSKKIDITAWYAPFLKVALSKSLLNYLPEGTLDPALLLKRKGVIFLMFTTMLVDTVKVAKYAPSLIPQLFQQEGIAISGEAQLKSAPVTVEAPPKKKI